MQKRRKKAKQATSESYDELVNGIGQLMLQAQRLAEEHGLFPNHRELLACRHCGLKEDITFEGRLMTYYEGAEDVDTGLRFPEPDKNGVSKCPGCGGVVLLTEGDDELSFT